MNDLNQQILNAHARNDHGALIQLYTQAADQIANVDEACFFLTHAYVFALEAGDKAVDTLYARLKTHGRV